MADAVRQLLARSQPQPQALIGDLIATYWPDPNELIPSAALVELLGDFGLSPASSRTALSRLARRGRIVRTQVGRRTFYRHTRAGAERLAEARAEVLAFGAEPPEWDGRWTAVAFNVPERERAQRHLLRTRLRDAGFRPLYDALWISPRVGAEAAQGLLSEVPVERWTVLSGAIATPVDAGATFDVAQQRLAFDGFLDDFSAFPRVAASLSPREALVVRTLAWDRWRDVVRGDMDVPAVLLAAAWPRPAARALFLRLEEELARGARERVEQALAASS